MRSGGAGGVGKPKQTQKLSFDTGGYLQDQQQQKKVISRRRLSSALRSFGSEIQQGRSSVLQQLPNGDGHPFENPEPGQILTQQLGRGAMGKTQLYKNQNTGKQTVRKTVYNPINNQKLQKQYRVLAYLKQRDPHNLFLRVIEFKNGGTTNPSWFSSQVSNGFVSLDKILGQSKLNDECRLKLAKDVLDAVRFLHSIEVVHNDIKPSNILVNPTTCSIQIIDFGSAHMKSDGPSFTFQGTYAYTSPQLLRFELGKSHTFQELKKNDLWAAYLVADQILEDQIKPRLLRQMKKQKLSFYGNPVLAIKDFYDQNQKETDQWITSLKRRLRHQQLRQP